MADLRHLLARVKLVVRYAEQAAVSTEREPPSIFEPKDAAALLIKCGLAAEVAVPRNAAWCNDSGRLWQCSCS